MTWTAPKTFIANDTLSSAELNVHLRDNLLEAAPAKARNVGAYFVSNGDNTLSERIPTGDLESTAEQSASTSYVDLATIGPSVTATTQSQAFVIISCHMYNSGANAVWMSYDVSGTTVTAAADNRALMFNNAAGQGQRAGVVILHATLIPGPNTFTAKYRVSTAGTGTWSDRRIAILPF